MFPVFSHITAKRPGESMIRAFCCIYGGSEALKELMKDEIEAARKEMIYSLVSEGDISPERGAQKLGISVEQLKHDMSAWADRMSEL